MNNSDLKIGLCAWLGCMLSLGVHFYIHESLGFWLGLICVVIGIAFIFRMQIKLLSFWKSKGLFGKGTDIERDKKE